MLFIRKEQHEQLAIDEFARFKSRLKEHVREVFPLQISIVNDSVIEQFIESGVKQARSFGFETEATVQSFIDHMILLGADFCQDPLFTEISASLFDTEVEDLVQRHDNLYDGAWKYLDKTRGEGAVNLIRASRKLKKMLAKQVQTVSLDLNDLPTTLNHIYPEKYAAHSTETMQLFCAEAFTRAEQDKFEQSPAQALYIIIGFIAGIGFYHDPLFTGTVSKQLQALESTEDPTEKTKLLRDGAEAYLDRLFEAVL